MKENTNTALAFNTIVLYARLVIAGLCGFFTTRFALQALGVVDYGLFSVIGSIISFISIINTIMVSTSNRYISVAIGRGDINETNIQFNVCFIIHLLIAVITCLISFPVGDWYISTHLNYDGDISNAQFVFRITIIASIFTFICVPYHGLLTAKENFLMFCIPDVVSHFIRLVVAILLVNHFSFRLYIYTITMAVCTIYPAIIYIIYSHKNYHDIVKFRLIRDKQRYKEILSFSALVGYGAIAHVGKAQGAAVLVNLFYNTIMNTALGIANSVNTIICMFGRSIAQPIDPQITKCYASGNRSRCDYLLVLSTKLTYLLMLLISSPFLVAPEWVLGIWLGTIPPYAVTFTILVIIDALVDSLNSGVKSIVFASGNIKLFQMIPSTLKLCSIVAAYFVLKSGAQAYSLIIVYIAFTFMVFLSNQWILHKSLNYDNMLLIKGSYMPSAIITVMFLPTLLIKDVFHPIILIGFSILYLAALFFFIGLSKDERHKVSLFVSQEFNRT